MLTVITPRFFTLESKGPLENSKPVSVSQNCSLYNSKTKTSFTEKRNRVTFIDFCQFCYKLICEWPLVMLQNQRMKHEDFFYLLFCGQIKLHIF